MRSDLSALHDSALTLQQPQHTLIDFCVGLMIFIFLKLFKLPVICIVNHPDEAQFNSYKITCFYKAFLMHNMAVAEVALNKREVL
jgi:hypothetical protein